MRDDLVSMRATRSNFRASASEKDSCLAPRLPGEAVFQNTRLIIPFSRSAIPTFRATTTALFTTTMQNKGAICARLAGRFAYFLRWHQRILYQWPFMKSVVRKLEPAVYYTRPRACDDGGQTLVTCLPRKTHLHKSSCLITRFPRICSRRAVLTPWGRQKLLETPNAISAVPK